MNAIKNFIFIILCFCFTLLGSGLAYCQDSSLERFIGLSGVDSSLVSSVVDEHLCNAVMASRAAYFSTSYHKKKMQVSKEEIPGLLGAERFETLKCPNTLFWYLLTRGYEDKGVAYTKDIAGEKTLILSFRGVSMVEGFLSGSEWLGTLNCGKKEMELCGHKLEVHRGFLNAFEEMKDQALNLVRCFVDQEHVKRVIVTGHSKGGAVANLMAVAVKEICSDIPIELITFGAPTTFNKHSAAVVEEILGSENIRRGVSKKDIFTKVGYRGTFGRHAGKEETICDIVEASGPEHIHSIERLVGNIALQARRAVERKLKSLRDWAEKSGVFRG